MYAALDAAWAKYNKASRELRVLHDNSRRFLTEEPYRLEVSFDWSSGWHVLRVRVEREPPPIFGVLVGSVAHQCLSALNHVAWELAARKVGPRKVHQRHIRQSIAFPITRNPGEFGRRRVLPYVSKAARATFEELQPYRHRQPEPDQPLQHPLLLIDELANADKHRVLAAGYGAVDLYDVLSGRALSWSSIAREPVLHRIADGTRNLDDGDEIARVRFGCGNARARLRVEHQPAPELVLLQRHMGRADVDGGGRHGRDHRPLPDAAGRVVSGPGVASRVP